MFLTELCSYLLRHSLGSIPRANGRAATDSLEQLGGILQTQYTLERILDERGLADAEVWVANS